MGLFEEILKECYTASVVVQIEKIMHDEDLNYTTLFHQSNVAFLWLALRDSVSDLCSFYI